jgi:uncharacterized protein (TIGR03067 family)
VTAQWWIRGWIGSFLETVEYYHFDLPDETEWILPVWEFVAAAPNTTLCCLIGIVLLDGCALYFLDRHARVLREIWAAAMLATPLCFALYSGVAIAMPYQILYEGLSEVHDARDQAIAKELGKLAGTWRVVHRESTGEPESPALDIGDQLKFEDRRFLWNRPEGQEGGTIYLDLRRLPKSIRFSARSGPNPGSVRPAVYTIDEAKLVLCLAPLNSFGEDLPTDFHTTDPRYTTLVLERTESPTEDRSDSRRLRDVPN